MKRSIIVIAIVAGIGAGAYYMRRDSAATEASQGGAAGQPGRGGFGGQGGFGGGGGFGGPRLPMSVEVAVVTRADVSQSITVVGNLIAALTVATTPKINGRLETVTVRLGDRVSRGQRLATIDDREIREQVKQAEASFAVSAATIRQREADLRFADTNLERSRNLFERQLIPRQTLDDGEARFQAASAQLDLAHAQYQQSEARLDELKINLANTVISSPVNGFVGSRTLDPGAWVTPNSVFISVVDIAVVRLVANVVEKDLRRIAAGLRADVEVDAYPGEKFTGTVAHVAPVLDPATRTAQIEVEIKNAQYRLKPGMYAKVQFTVEQRDNALVVPTTAVVDLGGRRGVFLPSEGDTAKFHVVATGLAGQQVVEIASGLTEGERVITTGAAALRDGDRIVLPGAGQRAGEAGTERAGGRGGRGRPSGGAGAGGRGGAPARGEPSGQGAPVSRPSDGPSGPSAGGQI